MMLHCFGLAQLQHVIFKINPLLVYLSTFKISAQMNYNPLTSTCLIRKNYFLLEDIP